MIEAPQDDNNESVTNILRHAIGNRSLTVRENRKRVNGNALKNVKSRVFWMLKKVKQEAKLSLG